MAIDIPNPWQFVLEPWVIQLLNVLLDFPGEKNIKGRHLSFEISAYCVRNVDLHLVACQAASCYWRSSSLTKFQTLPGQTWRSSSSSFKPVARSGTRYETFSLVSFTDSLRCGWNFRILFGTLPGFPSFWIRTFRGFSKATLRRSIGSSIGMCLYDLNNTC